MTIRYYPAIVDRSVGGYGVTFPDLAGCTSAGETVEEAVLSAEEALSLHVRGMIEDGEPLPEPTAIDSVPRDSDIEEVARVLVRVALPGKVVRFNATMDEGLLSTIDDAAKASGMSRSAFLAEAARRMLG